jgi:hypothetical protein
MSRGLRGSSNGEQAIELRDTLQRACVERVDGDTGHLRQESNQRNEHEQSVESSESNIPNDAGNSGTATRNIRSRDAEHTSFPCKHCGDHVGNTVRPAISDHVERDYTDYIAATSAGRENVSTGIRASNEPRNFKQADAGSGDSIERRIGIPAGVTI